MRARLGGRARPGEDLLGDALHLAGVHLALVGLHDVADEPAGLLRVGEAEGAAPLLDQGPQRGLVHALRQVPATELDLEAELGGLGGAAVAELLELDQRLLELLPVRPDDLANEGVVHLAGEALRRPPLGDPRLDHPDDVGGPLVLVPDRPGQRLAQLLLQSHGLAPVGSVSGLPARRDADRRAAPGYTAAPRAAGASVSAAGR